jgi:hypothetical protein
MKKRKIATIVLQNNSSGIVYLQGQDILRGKKIINVYQNTNTLSSGAPYTGDFELSIIDTTNTIVYDRIPNNMLQRDASSQQNVQISFDDISLDKSFVRFLTANNNFIQLLFEYEEN